MNSVIALGILAITGMDFSAASPSPWDSLVDAKIEGRLAVAHVGTSTSLAPYQSDILDQIVFEPMLLPDPLQKNGGLIPLVATGYSLMENDLVVFHLNPNTRFHDDSPLRAEDIVNSYELFLQAKTRASQVAKKLVQRAEAQGDAVHFILLKGLNDQQKNEAILALASVRAAKQDPSLPDTMIGTGPYRLSESRLPKLSFFRDRQYWAGANPKRSGFFHFQEIEIHGFTELAGAYDAFRKGRINFLKAGYNYATKLGGIDGIKIVKEQNEEFGDSEPGLVFNPGRQEFKNQYLRQALIEAYDFSSINNVLFEGTHIHPDRRILTKRERLFSAFKLLEQSKISTPLYLSAVTSNPVDRRRLALYAADLEKLGIFLDVVLVPSGTMIEELLQHSRFDLFSVEQPKPGAPTIPLGRERDSYYIMDERILIPGSLPASKVFLYGYWFDVVAEQNAWRNRLVEEISDRWHP